MLALYAPTKTSAGRCRCKTPTAQHPRMHVFEYTNCGATVASLLTSCFLGLVKSFVLEPPLLPLLPIVPAIFPLRLSSTPSRAAPFFPQRVGVRTRVLDEYELPAVEFHPGAPWEDPTVRAYLLLFVHTYNSTTRHWREGMRGFAYRRLLRL